MKKSILAIVMVGGCLTVFAQTNPVRTTTTSQSTTNNSVTNSTTDPMNSVTNTQVNSATNNTVNASTSWIPVGSPNWGWNNYGLWNTRTDMNASYRNNNTMYNSSTNPTYNTTVPTGTTNMGTITTGTSNTYNNSANATPPAGSVDAMNTTGTTPMNTATGTTPMSTTSTGMNSTGAYDAYGASTPNYSTPIAAAPMNVQMNFSKEYPTSVGQTYTWNQYGDWYETQYIDKGRLTQYYYDQKGTGYSLSLPVLQTYVPEEIVDKALQKYGSGLYSIGMIKTADGMPAYSIGLLNRGELQMVHLKEDGSSAANVWRTEEPMADGMMNTTDANAAMGTQSNMATESTMTDDATMRMKEDKAKDMKWKESGKKEKKDKMKHKKEKMENKEDKMPK